MVVLPFFPVAAVDCLTVVVELLSAVGVVFLTTEEVDFNLLATA